MTVVRFIPSAKDQGDFSHESVKMAENPAYSLLHK